MRRELASGENEANDRVSRSGTAELTRDILSVLAHELGGVASALDLRAHVISSTISETDLKALRDLTEELRTTTRTIRLIRGTDGSGTLNPGRHQSLTDWWKMASRFVANALPRGTAVEADFSEGVVPASGLLDPRDGSCDRITPGGGGRCRSIGKASRRRR